MTDWTAANILAIDTSVSKLMLALRYGSDRTVKSNRQVEKSHGQQIIREIEALLNSASLSKDQINGLVVSTGPGSFTGLRIGLACAKGLAVALDLPLVGISLFEIASNRLKAIEGSYRILVPFVRGQYFVAEMHSGNNPVESVESMNLEEIRSAAAGIQHFAMGCESDSLDELRAAVDGLKLLEYDGGDLVDMGLTRFESGTYDDIGSLEPMYVQKSQAEIRFDKRRSDR